MRNPNIWYQFNLQWQKALIFSFLVLFVLPFTSHELKAQKKINLGSYDDKAMHYGFVIGIQRTRWSMRMSEAFTQNTDTSGIIGVQAKTSPSFSLGFLIDLSMDEEYWNFRFTPNVSFYEQRIDYLYANPDFDPENPSSYREYFRQEEAVEAAFFEFPLLFKYKSLRRGNMRVYMTGGIVPGMKVGGRRTKLDKEKLSNADVNLEITYGFGLDMYMYFFKFSPEIRFSHGLIDTSFNNGSSFSNVIDHVNTHRITVYLNFE